MGMAGECVRHTRPLICVTPRWYPAEGIFCAGESIGDLFMDALLDAGAMPIMMPITADEDLIRSYVELCDGFAIPGGHDIDPLFWGEDALSQEGLCPERDALELPLVRMILEANKPYLGICRGAQLLNVALGGSLHQDLKQLEPQGRSQLWTHAIILDSPAHPVEVVEDSLLWRCTGAHHTLGVNSSHNQCVASLGRGVRVSGRATDGIIEAIEVPSQRFCLGVQWHPEYTWRLLERDRALFQALVDAARGV